MTDRTYRWEGCRPGRRVHVVNPATGKTWCQLENMRRKRAFDSEGTALPLDRRVCANCISLEGRDGADYREPSLGVLLGERVAEEGPDLFTTVPEPRKQGRQVRGLKITVAVRDRESRRSKERKPKRSKVKHDRPFDDPLPW